MKITKLYSDYDEYYDEKLYSTGNEDLDELLERAFCEGYEYAQREFAYVNPNQAKQFFTKVGNPKGINSMMPSGFTKAFESRPNVGKSVFRREVVGAKTDPLQLKQIKKDRHGDLKSHYEYLKNAKKVGIF